jgi:flavin reductase ActVB
MNESVSSATFREALARFASGVTIVTAEAPAGPVGFTASAFTSVSLAPPLVLVCIAKTASAHDAVVCADHFGVSILTERQAWIAEQFARSGIDRFRDVPLRDSSATGRVPLVAGALVQLECVRETTHEAGDHTILLGRVLAGRVEDGRPLVHFARRFGGFVAYTAARGPDSSEALEGDDA